MHGQNGFGGRLRGVRGRRWGRGSSDHVFQRDGALQWLANSRLGRVAPARAARRRDPRIGSESGTCYGGGHSAGARNSTGGSAGRKTLLPFDVGQVNVDPHKRVGTAAHESQGTEAFVTDIEIDQRRGGQRIQLPRSVVQLELPQELP